MLREKHADTNERKSKWSNECEARYSFQIESLAWELDTRARENWAGRVETCVKLYQPGSKKNRGSRREGTRDA